MGRYRIYYIREDGSHEFTRANDMDEVKAFVAKYPRSRVFFGKYEIFIHEDGTYHTKKD